MICNISLFYHYWNQSVKTEDEREEYTELKGIKSHMNSRYHPLFLNIFPYV